MVSEFRAPRADARPTSNMDGALVSKGDDGVTTESTPVASVVICTFNRPQMLEVAVRSCLANATRKNLNFEIVIADNSVDGHAAALLTKFMDGAISVRCVPASPPNIAIARNAGVKASRAPLIAFLDDDAEVETGWLDALVETMVHTGADAAMGPVHARFIGEPPKWDSSGSGFSRLSPYASGTAIAVVGPGRTGDFALGTGNSIWRVSTCFTDAVPFDPQFGAAGGEDLDLYMRIAQRGRRIVWCAEAVASEVVPIARTTFSNQILRVFSSAQGYAAASIKNSTSKWSTSLSIMLRGAAQAIAYGVAAVSLGVLAIAGSVAADVAQKKYALKMSAGLGKALWWRRLAYYHMENAKSAQGSAR